MFRKLVIGVVATILTVFVVAFLTRPKTASDGEGPVSPEPGSATAQDGSSATPPDTSSNSRSTATIAPPVGAREATVSRLADGDSFDIRWIDTNSMDELRLLGLNAPEVDACFGNEARSALADLIEGQILLVDGIERDEFGRVLAEVWVRDVLINVALVEQGAALSLAGDGPHSALIAEAQQRARQKQLGLWSPQTCGATGTNDVAISIIVFDAPGPDNERPNEEWIEIVNSSVEAIELSGWSIRDESTRNRFNFPQGFTLDDQASVRVHSGCGTDNSDHLYWCSQDPVWNNGGDTGFLVNSDGHFVDTYSYSG